MVPVWFVYLFKANLALAVFCGIHYAMLHRLTFVKGNRWFLLGGVICALLLPLVPVNDLLVKHAELQQVAVLYLPSLHLPLPRPTPARPIAWDILTVVFWVGVTVMAIRFMWQLLSLGRLHRSAQPAQIAGYRVHTLQQNVSPFSFFRNIYLNPMLHAPQALPGILRHEAVHVRQWHTLDVMLGALIQIFAWFNPAAWLLQHVIRENLEFITDRTLLREGMNAQQYQYSLLAVNGIPAATAITNNFNFSSLKNRIKMMNKQRSPQYQVLRYAIPMIAAGILVLMLNASRAALMPVKEKMIRLAAPLLAPDTTRPAGTDPGTAAVTTDSITVLYKGKSSDIITHPQSQMTIQFTDGASGLTGDNSHAVTVITHTPPHQEVETDTLITPSQPVYIVKDAPKPGEEPLYIIGGKEVAAKDLASLNGKDIANINVFKGPEAIARFGPKAKNGVIIVELDKKVDTLGSMPAPAPGH